MGYLSDPPGHVRPFTFKPIPLPGLQVNRKFFLCMYLLILVGFAGFIPAVSLPEYYWIHGLRGSIAIGLVISILSSMLWFSNYRTEEQRIVSQLAQSTIGAALLREGETLADRRRRLIEDQRSTYPFLFGYDIVPFSEGGTAGRFEQRSAPILEHFWKTQIALETSLLDHQRRHLAGETVAYIGHLSSS